MFGLQISHLVSCSRCLGIYIFKVHIKENESGNKKKLADGWGKLSSASSKSGMLGGGVDDRMSFVGKLKLVEVTNGLQTCLLYLCTVMLVQTYLASSGLCPMSILGYFMLY